MAFAFGGASLFVCAATTRPALEQLSEESHDLYQHVQHEVVRIETPMPDWMLEIAKRDNPLIKWGQLLDAEVRRKLAAQSEGSILQRTLSAEVAPATRETTEPSTMPSMHMEPMATDEPGAGVTFMPRATTMPEPTTHFSARVNTIGLILDDAGHVLIPLYLEKDAASKGPITIYSPDGVCTAHFVGSDPKSNLTVVQMDKMVGRPAELDQSPPAIGSLVMILTPNLSSAQLVVWTGTNREFGVVAGMDGRVSGICRTGHLLSPRLFTSITNQLIATGSVKRALLGVSISELRPDDPLRRTLPSLGNRPAIMVVRVIPGSAADKGGIQQGDLILQLAGQDVEDPMSFAIAIAGRSGPTDLQVLRDGKLMNVHVVLKPE
ncbi:MAG TPA: PDZ domain-containing protein [Tepidisphaeraceae bacterium]|nr:PDZ domain-containing protein [Tepidisphaeraceae bacterium]